jgi:hypothetical protein
MYTTCCSNSSSRMLDRSQTPSLSVGPTSCILSCTETRHSEIRSWLHWVGLRIIHVDLWSPTCATRAPGGTRK